MPDAKTDQDLIACYADSGSDAAFRALVDRHINMVYSAARRQVRDAHLAEDVTQAVFVTLARKAAKLRAHRVPAAWLLQATAFECRNAMKRLRRRERVVAQLADMARQSGKPDRSRGDEGDAAGDPDAGGELSPHIDAALLHLKEADRNLIVLRFFQDKSYREAAAVLGITEASARQRVSRALEKVRMFLQGRGIATSGGAISIAFASHAMHVAPAHLAEATKAAALTKFAAASTTFGTKGALTIMAVTKTQSIAAAAILLIAALGIGTGVYAVKHMGKAADVVAIQAVAPVRPAISSAPVSTNALSLVINSPDGGPFRSVEVRLGTRDHPVSIYRPFGAAAVMSGPSGMRFGANLKGTNAVAIVSDAGCALLAAGQPDTATQAGPRVVTLERWARIEGTLQHAGQPVADAKVQLWHWNRTGLLDPQDDLIVKTDAAGHFVFARVMPGNDISLSYARPGAHYVNYLDVPPGQTVSCTLGGNGCIVIGRATPIVGSDPPIGWTATPSRMTHGQLVYLSGPAMNAVLRQRPMATFDINDDGSFRLDDLAPGQYRAELRLMAVSINGRYIPPAMAVGEFTVQSNWGEKQLDLGTLQTNPGGR